LLTDFKKKFRDLAQQIAAEEAIGSLSEDEIKWLWIRFLSDLKDHAGARDLSEEVIAELRKAGDEFLHSLKEEVDSCVILGDIDRLHGLVEVVDMFLGHRVIKSLRDKGFGEEITALCDKAGRVKEPRRCITQGS